MKHDTKKKIEITVTLQFSDADVTVMHDRQRLMKTKAESEEDKAIREVNDKAYKELEQQVLSVFHTTSQEFGRR